MSSPEYRQAIEPEEMKTKRRFREYGLIVLFFVLGEIIVWALLSAQPTPEPVPELRPDPETRALRER